MHETLVAYNKCIENGGKADTCSGGSIALKYPGRDGFDTDRLYQESKESLGF